MSESNYEVGQRARRAWVDGVDFVPQDYLRVSSVQKPFVQLNDTVTSRVDFLDSSLFNQTTQITSQPMDASQAFYTAKKSSHFDNVFFEKIMDIGTNGIIDVQIPGEMYVDASQRGATEISYAHSIDINRQVAQFALWDNGLERPIDDAVDIISELLDESNATSNPELVKKFENNFSLYTLVKAALYSRGKIVLAQGDQKVTLSSLADYTIDRHDETLGAPIESGVAMKLEVPFLTVNKQKPYEYTLFHSKNYNVSQHRVSELDKTGRRRRLTPAEAATRYAARNMKPFEVAIEEINKATPR